MAAKLYHLFFFSSSKLILGLCFTGLALGSLAQFQEKALDYGIDHLYTHYGSGGGISLCDINEDGRDDVSLATGYGQPIQVYLQTVSGGFQPWTPTGLETGLEAQRSISWIDFDNDGDKDLCYSYINMIPGNIQGGIKIYRMQTGGILQDISEQEAISSIDFQCYGHSWADIDLDGDLDLFVANYEAGEGSRLLINLGNGEFENQTNQYGLANPEGVTFTPVFVDLNQDGQQELFLANDRLNTENKLFSSQAGLPYLDISQLSTMNAVMDAMGVSISDYDQDLDLDVFVTNTASLSGNSIQGNTLFEQISNLQFQWQPGFPLGVEDETFWGCNFLDYDNDGDQDLFVVCGSCSGSDPGKTLYENLGQGLMVLYGGSEMDDNTGVQYASAIGDVNGDGHPDIGLTRSYIGRSQLWEAPISEHHWVKIHLKGDYSNRDAYGARLRYWVQGQEYVHITRSTSSYLGQDSDDVLIGLGTAEQIDSLCVIWPRNTMNKAYQLVEGERHVLVEDLEEEVLSSHPYCFALEGPPQNLNYSMTPVDGQYDRVQLLWTKDEEGNPYSDEDAAACDLKFWKTFNLVPGTDNPIGGELLQLDTTRLEGLVKNYSDGSPRSLFKWPLKFEVEGEDNDHRVQRDKRYAWQIRCSCEQGEGATTAWSQVSHFNTTSLASLDSISSDYADRLFQIKTLILHPNPMSIEERELFFRTDFEPQEIQVYDALGQRIESFFHKSGDAKYRIGFRAGLEPGWYHVQVYYEGFVEHLKLLLID